MKLAVVGSRTFNDYNYLHKKLTGLLWDLVEPHTGELPPSTFSFVSGGARGADSIAEQWARAWGYEITVFPAEWDKYGKSAGYRRNKDIVNYADIIVAFWDGKSKGTQHSINLAKEQNKPVFVYTDWNTDGTISKSSNPIKTSKI
jgi:predicted Rossmann fold nucleotide-binding protein DprA/Smf involved in DNA uptake